MFRRLFLAVLLAVVLVAGAACQPGQKPAPGGGVVKSTCGVGTKLTPKCGTWWGVAPNPLAGESWDRALTNFENQIQRPVNIVHYYHSSGQLFPTASEIARANQPGKERLLLINYKPEGGKTWAQVAAGAQDQRLNQLAAYIKANFNQPFFLTIHHEPEEEVKPTAGSGYTAQDYRAMYRHVVLRLRAQGATRIVTVMNYIGLPKWGSQPWFENLYPGNDVVDWIAYDPYIFGSGSYWGPVSDLFNRKFPEYPKWPGFYSWATQFAPGKPLMLAEWGVGEQPGNPAGKPDFFKALGSQAKNWPAVKAMVYWNAAADRTVGATRIDSTTASLQAYRNTGLMPYFNP